MKESTLLTLDAGVNLFLGVPLIFFPKNLAKLVGIPVVENSFYPSILGAVLTGIGLALLLERFKGSFRVAGLSLGGAGSINLCGALVLAAWLVSGSLDIPARGYGFLWALAAIVAGMGVFEMLISFKDRRDEVDA